MPQPPVSDVLDLDPAVADAFTEQSSLQTGRRAVNDAPIRLLQVLATGPLQRRLELTDALARPARCSKTISPAWTGSCGESGQPAGC